VFTAEYFPEKTYMQLITLAASLVAELTDQVSASEERLVRPLRVCV
jgi:hypothetical protein